MRQTRQGQISYSMALALLPSPSPTHHPLYQYQPLERRSAPMDRPTSSRPSLPSISSLIEAVNDQTDGGKAGSPKSERERRISGGSPGHSATSPDRPSLVGSPRRHPAQTPELPPASSFSLPRPQDNSHSPTSSRSGAYPQPPSSTNPELYAQRNSSYPPIPEGGSSYPPLPDTTQWPPQSQARSPTGPASQEASRPALTSRQDGAPDHGQYPGLALQRPLPVFPSVLPGQPLPPIDPQMAPAPTWQHHHYYPPANPPSYPQTQERYICPTCAKPFSRPSSLKIHTYSHTGEKPYKCKHEGCGKHFSVRSNMKRHEKGCHGTESNSAAGNSPGVEVS